MTTQNAPPVIAKREGNERCGNPTERRTGLLRRFASRNDVKRRADTPSSVIAKREGNERCGNPTEERARLLRHFASRNDCKGGERRKKALPYKLRWGRGTVIAKREGNARCGNPKEERARLLRRFASRNDNGRKRRDCRGQSHALAMTARAAKGAGNFTFALDRGLRFFVFPMIVGGLANAHLLGDCPLRQIRFRSKFI